MPIRIKQQKKEKSNQNQHPDYMLGAERTWADDDRERTQSSFRKNFIAIIAVVVIIAIILIVAAVTAVLPAITSDTQISAADSFAISQAEQNDMANKSVQFAQGVLVYAYCSDQDTAFQGKNAALQVMGSGSDSYDQIFNMQQVYPVIEPQNFVPVTTEPILMTNTQAYAGQYVYELDAVAVDSSVKDGGEDGTYADAGYHMTLTFSNVIDDDTNEPTWVIANAKIVPY